MGGELRRRSIGIVGALVVLTGSTGVWAAASAGANNPPVLGLQASSEPTTTVDDPSPDAHDETSTTPLPSATSSSATSTLPTTTTTSVAVSPTTTTEPCRNSTNPACGPFRWDPDPGPNEPLTVSVTFTPAHPHPGEPVTFFVRAVDPDATWFWRVSMDYGDPPGAGAIDGSSWDANAYPDYCAPAKYGPWTPPPRRAGDETLGNPPEKGIAHTYAAAGAYRARFWFGSDSTACGLHEPYGSYGAQSVEVVVLPAETTTSTTEPQ